MSQVINVLKSDKYDVANYKTAAATTGGRHAYTWVTAQRVTTFTEDGPNVRETAELYLWWRCTGCDTKRGIRAPYEEGDIATRQIQQEARDHADGCRL
jgi:hypothetical protein